MRNLRVSATFSNYLCGVLFLFMSVIWIIFFLLLLLSIRIYEINAYIFAFFALFAILIIAHIAGGLFFIIYTFVKNIKIKQLTKTGRLIKDIPCKISPKGLRTSGYPLIFEANYTWKWGLGDAYAAQGYIVELEYNGLKLKSEVKYKIDIRRNTADLLIDPMNPKNYFIDFDITEN